MNVIAGFFDTEGFMPHGMCLLWKPSVFWMHVLADAGIVLAYYSIPIALIQFVRKRKDIPFSGVFYMFGAFILLCGTTHLMGIWTLWHPDYAIDGLLKLATAIVSVITAWTCWRLMPLGLALPSAAQLGRLNDQLTVEIADRRQAEARVWRLNAELETRVRERTAELEAANGRLREALNANMRIFESSLDIISTINARGEIVNISPRCNATWGYTPDELIGTDYLDLIHPDDHDDTIDASAEIVSGMPTTNLENRVLRKDGSVVPMMWSVVWSDADQNIYAVGRDMTERLEMEEKLRRTQQLESIGQLTGGIAHDFNNLLMIILGNTDLLVEKLEDQPKLQRLASMIQTAAERGAELTQRLLAFARRQVLAPQVIDMNARLANIESMLQRTLGAQIEIEVVKSPNLWLTEADPGQLDAALLNLTVNARDAMPNGGQLLIETANAVIDEKEADEHPGARAGDYVMVTITDTGEGMPPEIIARAFEPFFTTKEVGKGTGLGLSMVYGFAQQSGGYVTLSSEPDKGTVVKMFFPRADRPITQIKVSAPVKANPTGTETILVVEDDALVRSHVEQQLKDAGYFVITAPDGPTALDIVRSGTQIDLLFTDMIMPGGMNGGQLATTLRALRPDLAVLFTSGYTEEGIVNRDGRLEADVHLLMKPYRKHDLTQKVRGILDGTLPTQQ